MMRKPARSASSAATASISESVAVLVEDLLAGLEHQLEELGLVVLGGVGQQDIGEQIGVALVELVEVVGGCIPVARSHTTEYRLLTHAPGRTRRIGTGVGSARDAGT